MPSLWLMEEEEEGLHSHLQMKWEPRSLGLGRRKAPPVGLRNLGNSCYLNSVLQCLTHTPPLAHFCLRLLHSSACPRNCKAPCPFCLLERRIARSLSLDLPAALDDAPSRIAASLRLFADHFRPGRQEDAHEFLRFVIDACHDSSLRLPHPDPRRRTVVRDIFGGSLLSRIRCLSCGQDSDKTDDIMDISLDLVQSKTLLDALRRFFRPETLDGDNKYNCDSCKKLSPARKQMFVLQAPNVLVIQLKRFEGINGGKINRDIAFEEVLLLSNFMCRGSQDPNPQYNLFGSIVHSGYSPESGHYYAYVKDPYGRWYCCNDSDVHPSSTQEVLSEKVYILFYLRENQGQKSVKTILPSADQKLPESIGNGLEILKPCGTLKPLGEAMLQSERNVTSALNNGKLTNPQIKFGKLKIFHKNDCSSTEEKGHLRIDNDTKSERDSSSKQLTTVSEKTSLPFTGMGVKNSAASYSKGESNGTIRADIPNANDQVTVGSVPLVATVDNINALEETYDDPVKDKADAHMSGTGSGFEVQRTSPKKISGSSSNGINKKRKSNAQHSTILSSHCSTSGVFKEYASCGSDKDRPAYTPEGLQNLIERLLEITREELQSCGWTDEVHKTMLAQKRRCVEAAAGSPLDKSDMRDLLVADSKKIFISRIPHVLKEDLIAQLRRFFVERKHGGGNRWEKRFLKVHLSKCC